nr:unnamed protein product [Callosobruchus analis]
MRLAITLRFLATGDSYKSLMYLFQVSYSTISLIVPEVCEAISSVLKDYIKWKDVARNFEIKWNFPHCIGAIDGKHVQIICPANTGTEYFNYKKTFSIVLMAIVDGNYCFQYVHIGCQGRMSDGGVYKNTSFHKALQENQLNIPMPESLPGREKLTPYVFVADDAFALTINFMKPYAGQLSQSPERVFNYRLSRARRIVENAFGIMASVFRVFRKPMQLKVDNVEKITKACVYLHNYLRKSKTSRSLYTPSGSFDNEDLENGTIIPGTWRSITQNDAGLICLDRVPRRPPTDAKLIREEFKEYFMTAQGKVEWQDIYQ